MHNGVRLSLLLVALLFCASGASAAFATFQTFQTGCDGATYSYYILKLDVCHNAVPIRKISLLGDGSVNVSVYMSEDDCHNNAAPLATSNRIQAECYPGLVGYSQSGKFLGVTDEPDLSFLGNDTISRLDFFPVDSYCGDDDLYGSILTTPACTNTEISTCSYDYTTIAIYYDSTCTNLGTTEILINHACAPYASGTGIAGYKKYSCTNTVPTSVPPTVPECNPTPVTQAYVKASLTSTADCSTDPQAWGYFEFNKCFSLDTVFLKFVPCSETQFTLYVYSFYDTNCTTPLRSGTIPLATGVCYSSILSQPGIFSLADAPAIDIPEGVSGVREQIWDNSACSDAPIMQLLYSPDACVSSGTIAIQFTCNSTTVSALEYLNPTCSGTPAAIAHFGTGGPCTQVYASLYAPLNGYSCVDGVAQPTNPPTDAPTAAPTVPPTTPPTQNPSDCGNTIILAQEKTNQWLQDGLTYTQWIATVQTTASATYEILLDLALPAGASIVYLYGADVVSGTEYSVSDWRFSQGLLVPSGTVFHIGYELTSASQAQITVSATCSPAPKDCKSIVTQQKLNAWQDATNDYAQYAFYIVNVGTSPVNSIDISVTLSNPSSSISADYNLNGSVNNGVFTANIPLWNLAPGNTAGGFFGYTVTAPISVGLGSDPTYEILDYNCQLSG
eukprot:Phypoly_transcript_03850.p1 GENE.Phypoly_transcript_03850~~Phypoly_transcript_03850.p1  ORF type:complete len:672 (+),score=99.78 Phypoly_transcript_03850:318-2333(+)